MSAHTPDGAVIGFYGFDGHLNFRQVDERLRLGELKVVPAPILPHDAHACISMGTDASGMIHAVFGAHASKAWHIRLSPNLAGNDSALPLSERPGLRLTYPMLLSASGPTDLLLLYREGGAWSGEMRVQRWVASSGRFCDDLDPLISGQRSTPTSGPYLNRPVPLPDGRLGMFYVWRLAPKSTSAGDVLNVGMDYVVTDRNLDTIRSFEGVELSRPITQGHSPRVLAVPLGSNLINQCGAAVDPAGNPVAITYWSDASGIPQYKIVRFDGNIWCGAQISHFRTRFSLQGRGTLPLPHSRPELIIRPDGTALCFFRSVEFRNRLMVSIMAPPFDDPSLCLTMILLDEDLGHYEPIIDHTAYERTGNLILYVQWCAQGLGDSERNQQTAPARLIMWSADQVASWRSTPLPLWRRTIDQFAKRAGRPKKTVGRHPT